MSVIDKALRDLPLSREEVIHLIRTAPARYKVHEIEKRHGRGKRVIAQPTAEIKLIQRIMLRMYIDALPVSSAATAYRHGLGIKDHATPHAQKKYLLKLDFKDFFPSIKVADFVRHLRKFSDVSMEDARLLGRLFFWRPKGQRQLILSIGAPSSPAISNTLMFDFDSEVQAYCISHGVTYTRYADDLAFSTNTPNVLRGVHEFIELLCLKLKSPRLTINDEKTVYTSKKRHRELTGLVLSNSGTASIGRDKKRIIRAMAYQFREGRLAPDQSSKLRGLLAFAISVDMPFVDSIKTMVGEEKFTALMRGRSNDV